MGDLAKGTKLEEGLITLLANAPYGPDHARNDK